MWPRLIERWKGVTLTLIGVVATVWLALSGQLGLYIHPRYFGFTAVMAVIGGILALVALTLVPARDEQQHEHEHASHGHRTAVLGAVLSTVVVVGAVVALLVFPPATLTAQTAVERDIDRTTADLAGDAPSLAGADPSRFTVKDWALLLRQTDDPSAFSGEQVALTGFITPAPGDPEDRFYVARFTVTCCAVDAQPVGVAVHLPGWRDTFAVDDWVVASGSFGADPAGGDGTVLIPETVEPTEQPEQPYVF